MKHILTALFIGLFAVTIATSVQQEIMIDRMQTQVTELRQQVDEMQGNVNFMQVEYGVLWRMYMETKIKEERGK
ncbi:hypothetical protein FDZ73_22370 [bacterium]|nr:MAG: hypothetical protein FDZ73_22370 [bacterium]